MKTLSLAALALSLLAAPAFANPSGSARLPRGVTHLPPGPCRGAVEKLACTVTPVTRASLTYTVYACAARGVHQVIATRPGQGAKPVVESQWSVTLEKSPRAAPGSHVAYSTQGFELSYLPTGTPAKDGSHAGKVLVVTNGKPAQHDVACLVK